jgi:C-methyltransferase
LNPILTEKDLDALMRASRAHAVIAAWAGAGLFDALADSGPLAPDDLPADSRAIATTAPILFHLGLLAGDGARWCLSRAGRALHASGALRIAGAADALGDLSRLDAVLAEGGPVKGPDGRSRVSEGGVREQDLDGTRRFMDYLYRRAEHSAQEVAAHVAPMLAAGAHVLDLGGGHGRYAGELVQRGLRATLFDRPVVVEIARERFGDAIGYATGDFLADPLGGPYDAVLLSNIVHGLGPGENRHLLGSIALSLRPGGLVVLKDMFLSDTRADPESAVFFNLTMLCYTREGRSYSLPEMRAIFQEVGLVPDGHWMIPDTGFTLVFGRRGAA